MAAELGWDAWVTLLVLAATVGLGYRIFVVRRYVAMDIIIPYVLWMTALLFLTDWFIQWVIRKRYVWVDK
jgi:NitT/TauT family transport system permease protein